MAHPRLDASSLRDQYGTHLQIGLALSLTLLLAFVHLFVRPERTHTPKIQKQEAAHFPHVHPTRKEQAPPRPPVPQVVPDAKIAESNVEFDASLNFDAVAVQNATSSSETSGSGWAKTDDVQRQPDCGGQESIQEKIHYPPSALTQGLEGRVLVRFVVNKKGEIEHPNVVRGAHQTLNQAALCAVRRLECTPGKKRSRPVKVQMTMPVPFALPQRLEP